MKKTTTKTSLVKETYHLTEELKYIIDFKNGKEVSRSLEYKGKGNYGYGLTPIYRKDISLLSKTNPYWLNEYSWFEGDKLPEPEKVNLKNIIYCQGSSHMFFDLNKKPIPVVHQGNYIGANLDNGHYDLVKLREYLLKKKNVISVSEILNIPYYNAERGKNKYIQVLVLPDSDTIQKGLDNKWNREETIFGRSYDKNFFDYLGMKKFAKEEVEENSSSDDEDWS